MKNSGICQLAWANGSCFGDVFPGIYAAENSTHGEVDQDKLSFFLGGLSSKDYHPRGQYIIIYFLEFLLQEFFNASH